jgi:hypothetical protein
LGYSKSQFLEFGDFGAFKERLRSVVIEEIGKARERLPRVSGGFAPFGSPAESEHIIPEYF